MSVEAAKAAMIYGYYYYSYQVREHGNTAPMAQYIIQSIPEKLPSVIMGSEFGYPAAFIGPTALRKFEHELYLYFRRGPVPLTGTPGFKQLLYLHRIRQG